jgi:mRNA interferase MazF
MNPIILSKIKTIKTTMQEGSIILTNLPQADGTYKLRPVLVLRQLPNTDFLVCGISTQLNQQIIDFDEILNSEQSNGLKADSLIRLSFLAVLSVKDTKKTIGFIHPNTHRLLLKRLSNYLVA